jgi:hypothetical protein
LVLWLVHPWFITAEEDSEDERLLRYLDPKFSQHLIRRQNEVDAAVRRLALPGQVEVEREGQAQSKQLAETRLRHTWNLPTIRRDIIPQLRLALGLNEMPQQAGPDLSIFLQSLTLAKHATDQWGGNFVVVLLPSYGEVVSHHAEGTARHEHLAHLLRQNGISVIDGVELFLKEPDPAHLYVMRINNHPTAEGYALLAVCVLAQIRRDPQSKVALAP